MSKQTIAVCLTDTHLKEENFQENHEVYMAALKYCKSAGINTLFHLSDIFNSRKAQSESVLNFFGDILEKYEEEGISILTFPGNHDKTSYSSEKSFLRPFRKHSAFILQEVHYHYQHNNEFVFHFIPFFSDDRYRVELESARTVIQQGTYEKGLKHILYTHIGFSGARMNSGLIVDGIKPSEVSLFSRVFVGHYHDKQTVGDNIQYIGASLQHNFGETTDKGLTIIFDDMTTCTIDIGTKRYLKQEVNVDTLKAEQIHEITRIATESKDQLRIILTGSEEKVKSFNKQQLMAAGVSVETKTDKVEREDIVDRVEPFTPLILTQQFEKFCENNKLDIVKGKSYLSQVS